MITIVMIVILLISLGLMLIIDAFIVETLLNWLYGGIVGIFILILWYSITIFYFWKTIEKQKLKPGYESLEMLKEEDEKSN